MSCGVPSAWPTSLDGLLSLGKAQSELKEQKKIGGAKACGLRRGALCVVSRLPLLLGAREKKKREERKKEDGFLHFKRELPQIGR